jgi:hypothetical protein
MGCDIHFFREKREGGKWITADKWEFDSEEEWLSPVWGEYVRPGRNYELFSILAGVRQREVPVYSFAPRGLPLGCCDEIKRHSDGYGVDGHSHSYLYLHELLELREFLDSNTQKISGMKHRDEIARLQASIALGSPDWNLLYPYCQGTNAKDFEEFLFEAPASFVIGDGLNTLIEGLQNIGGDLQRGVFFFDN